MAEHTIQYTLDIHADVETVWKILTDFDSFPVWNPMIVKLTGTPVVGKKLKFAVKQTNGKLLKLDAKFQIVANGKELRWGGGVKGLLYAEHYFILEKIDEQSCRLHHGETFSGLIISLLWWWLKPNATPLYQLLSDALKKRAEEKVSYNQQSEGV